MAKSKPYDHLPLMPEFIADIVTTQQYTGMEHSIASKSQKQIEETEALRLAMTTEQKEEFCKLVDKRCRKAYEVKAEYFMKAVRSTNNSGRNQMYVWISHWLASYLKNPEALRRAAAD